MYIRMASGDTWKLADIEQVVGYLGMFSPHFGYLNPIYYFFFYLLSSSLSSHHPPPQLNLNVVKKCRAPKR